MSITSGTRSGFTLIEALLSLVILTLMASVMTGLYFSGLQALDVQGEVLQFDSALRSKMEFLLSQNFDQLASGSDNVVVGGANYTLVWTVTAVDLDGDTVAETTALQITLTLAGRSLATIVVNNEGQIGKIS